MEIRIDLKEILDRLDPENERIEIYPDGSCRVVNWETETEGDYCEDLHELTKNIKAVQNGN